MADAAVAGAEAIQAHNLSVSGLQYIFVTTKTLQVIPSGSLVIGKRALCRMLKIEGNDVIGVSKRLSDERLSQVGFREVKMRLPGTRRDIELCLYATIDTSHAHVSPDGSMHTFKFDEAMSIIAPLANLLWATQTSILAERACRQQRSAVSTLTALGAPKPKRRRSSNDDDYEPEEDDQDYDDDIDINSEEYAPMSRAKVAAAAKGAARLHLDNFAAQANKSEIEETLLLQRIVQLREEVAYQTNRADKAEADNKALQQMCADGMMMCRVLDALDLANDLQKRIQALVAQLDDAKQSMMHGHHHHNNNPSHRHA